MFYPSLYTSLTSCSLILNIVIHLSFECRNMMLHILNSIPQLILPWVVLLIIDLILHSPLLLLCRLWHLISWVHSLSDWFCDPILVFPAVFWIYFCWTNAWMVECTLECLLGLLDLVSFLFSVILYPGCLLVIISCFDVVFYSFLGIL